MALRRWAAVFVAAVLTACGDGAPANPPPDAGAADAGGEVAVDVAPDVVAESGIDAQPDVAVDAAPDVAMDVAPDVAMDATTDAAPDVAVDDGVDAGPDAAPDAAPDAPADVAPDACADGLATCSTACVDLMSDPRNCGACGRACAPAMVCVRGVCDCGCPAGSACCDGVCRDLSTDRTSCGACGRACASGEVCMEGLCVPSCAAGLTPCGGRCVDTRVDAMNCGACGNACSAGPRATAAGCVAGRCAQTCEAGFGDCDGAPANGCEVDLTTAAAHCGACGNGCAAASLGTDRCVAGRCAARSCAAIRDADARAPDGQYLLDLDGPGALEARTFYCDMTGGGWTLVENQVPSDPLPDVTATVNPTAFGRTDASWRLGVPDILAVRPAVAWKLTDATNSVYLRPACVVDWRINYYDIRMPTDCTTGYTSEAFTAVVNGTWVHSSARGIGINNSGRNCSIRGSEGGPASEGAGPHGRAYSCNYSSTTERVSLWFR